MNEDELSRKDMKRLEKDRVEKGRKGWKSMKNHEKPIKTVGPAGNECFPLFLHVSCVFSILLHSIPGHASKNAAGQLTSAVRTVQVGKYFADTSASHRRFGLPPAVYRRAEAMSDSVNACFWNPYYLIESPVSRLNMHEVSWSCKTLESNGTKLIQLECFGMIWIYLDEHALVWIRFRTVWDCAGSTSILFALWNSLCFIYCKRQQRYVTILDISIY